MASLLGNTVLGKNEYSVRIANSRQSVGNGKGGTSLGKKLKRLLNKLLAFIVKSAGRLVKYQYRRIFQKYTGNGYPLLLSARKLHTALAHIGVVAVGHSINKLVRPRKLSRLHDLLICGILLSVSNIFTNTARKQINVLRHNTDILAKRGKRDILYILPVKKYLTLTHVVKSRNKRAKRSLSATRGSHKRNALTRLDLQIKIGQHVLLAVSVVEAHTAEFHLTANVIYGNSPLGIGDLRLSVHNLAKSLNTRKTALELLGKLHDPSNRCQQSGNEHKVSHVIRRAYLVFHHKHSTHDHHNDIHNTVKKPSGGLKSRHSVVDLLFYAKKSLVSPVELLLLKGFVGKGLDHTDTEQTVLYRGIQLTHLNARLPKALTHTPVKEGKHNKHNGNYRKNSKCQRNTHRAKNNKGADYLDTRNKELLGTVMGKLRNIKKVAGNSRHKTAHLGVVIVGKGKLLQMPEEIPTHIGLKPSTHNMPHRRHIIMRHRVDDTKHDIKHTRPDNKLKGQCHRLGGSRIGYLPDYKR